MSPQRSDNDKLSITLPAGDVASLCREALAEIGPPATEYANARGEWFDQVLQQADVLRDQEKADRLQEVEAYKIAMMRHEAKWAAWYARYNMVPTNWLGMIFAGPEPERPKMPLSMLCGSGMLSVYDHYREKAEWQLSDSKPREPIGYRDVEPLERMAEAAEALGGEMTIKHDWVQVLQRATVYAGRVSG